jgi:hypothetical protein
MKINMENVEYKKNYMGNKKNYMKFGKEKEKVNGKWKGK